MKVTTTKTGDTRTVFWTDETNNVLQEYYNKYEKSIANYFFITNSRDKCGTRLKGKSLYCNLRRRRHKKYIKLHSFRHAFGVRCVESGMNLKHIQKLMGHKKLETTEIYLQMSNEVVKNAYKEHFS